MADATLERFEKQLEGNNLALSAVAEVLQKMDHKFSLDEESALAKQEEVEAAHERTGLIKEIASEVVGMLKADAGLNVDGTKVRSAAKTGKAGADDAEKPVTPTTKIEDQQATIQAMMKGAANDYPVEGEGQDDDEAPPANAKKGGMKYKAADDEDKEDLEKEGEDKDEDEEIENDEDEDGKADDETIEGMQKQLATMKKQFADYESNMAKAIETESENRLRKMGFREENGLQAPKRVALGLDGTTPIQKSKADASDIADQLADLSYKQLRDLQVNIEMGKTEGVPRELLG
jgi:hypothetical protein